MNKSEYSSDVDMQSKISLEINRNFDDFSSLGSNTEDDLLEWYPSQVKGPVDDEVQEGRVVVFKSNIWFIDFWAFVADLISTIEFNEDGELLAVGDKGGRIVVFQREQQVEKRRLFRIENDCSNEFRRKHRHFEMNTMFT